MVNWTTNYVIQEAKVVHNGFYDYSKIKVSSSKEKIEILCPLHGSFFQSPFHHIVRHQGCPHCSVNKVKPALSQDEFLKRCKEIHGDTYDYSKAKYSKHTVKVAIVCSSHGIFYQSPEGHWRGYGCPSCGCEKTASLLKLSQQEFILRCQEKHKNRYDYSNVVYINNGTKVKVICPFHGEFMVQPDHHMEGVGCLFCANVKRADVQRHTLADFLDKSKKVHGDRYDYSKVVYKGAKNKVEIVCSKHGSFWMAAESHYIAKQNCPSCGNHYTLPQKEVEAYIATLVGTDYIANTRAVIPPKELDIYIPSKKFAIEFNGIYWHSVTAKSSPKKKMAHKNKYWLCQQKGVELIQIEEQEWRTRRPIWESIIASRLGKHQTKIQARKTIFREVSKNEADQFLNEHHLQGSSLMTRWHFGLFYQGTLVGVLAYAWLNKEVSLNLVRLAFPKGVTIVGGAQKLFKHSLLHIPPTPIVTYSNNRYSSGRVYQVLGFSLDKKLPPSYQWFYKQKIWNKRHYRHSKLPQALGGKKYNPVLTEHENMFKNGARCLYDAGYIRWVYAKNEYRVPSIGEVL
jgi:hypothetical protein